MVFFRNYKNFTGFLNFLICLLLLICQVSTAFGTKLIYAGTFDPFTKAHFLEATSAFRYFKKNNPEAELVISPIENAYYAVTQSGQHYPKLFDFSTRVNFIRDIFRENSSVLVTSTNKTIKNDVFRELTNNIPNKKSGEKIVFLVGTDVLSVWADLPGFVNFKNSVEIIVSADASDRATFEKLKNKFKDESRISVIDFDVPAIRAADVKKSLLNDFSGAKKYLHGKTYSYLQAHKGVFTTAVGSHERLLRKFVREESVRIIVNSNANVSHTLKQTVTADSALLEDVLLADASSLSSIFNKFNVHFNTNDILEFEKVILPKLRKNASSLKLANLERSYLNNRCGTAVGLGLAGE